MRRLQHMSVCELEQLYALAEPGAPPVGCLRGKALVMTGNACPLLSARLGNLAWKGKCFCPDGAFINRWPAGIKALGSCAAPGPSWYDGRPSLIMEYPSETPIFRNVHDEIREVAPGLYLGRLYERCPCRRFLGYFALEVPGCYSHR